MPVVVELYTSQGCSSCPAADAMLGQLSSHKDVIALSLPVTYWDMLGWKDTLASDGNTRRQKAYAKQLGRSGIYTPEIIIDGETELIGSREAAVQAAIAVHSAEAAIAPVDLAGDRQRLRISIGPAADRIDHDATVWLLGILPQATVNIGDGENSGRKITYHNVVREIRAVGNWKGSPLLVSIPRAQAGAPHENVAVVVQQAGYGRVIGAAMLNSASDH